MVSLNEALLGPYFLGGVALGGGTLGSHDFIIRQILLLWVLELAQLVLNLNNNYIYLLTGRGCWFYGKGWGPPENQHDNGKPTMNEDVFLIQNGAETNSSPTNSGNQRDFPMSC